LWKLIASRVLITLHATTNKIIIAWFHTSSADFHLCQSIKVLIFWVFYIILHKIYTQLPATIVILLFLPILDVSSMLTTVHSLIVRFCIAVHASINTSLTIQVTITATSCNSSNYIHKYKIYRGVYSMYFI